MERKPEGRDWEVQSDAYKGAALLQGLNLVPPLSTCLLLLLHLVVGEGWLPPL